MQKPAPLNTSAVHGLSPQEIFSPMTTERRKAMAVRNFRERARQLLGNIELRDLPLPENPVVIISPSDSLVAAFEKLLTNHVHSAPVEGENGKFLGLLETRDLVLAVVNLHKQKNTTAPRQTPALTDVVGELRSMTERAQQQQIRDETSRLDGWSPSYFARLHPLQTVTESTTLLEVCRLLAQTEERVIQLDAHGKIVRVVSRSWVAGAIFDLMDEIDSELGSVPASALPIEAFGIVPKQVHICLGTDPAITAFEVMLEFNVSSVPVVDSENKITGVISASTLGRFLHNRDLSSLDSPASEFVTAHSRSSKASGTDQQKPTGVSFDAQPATVVVRANSGLRVDSTVSQMFESLVGRQTHRLFLVDAKHAVVGVCSLKDVLKALF